MYKVTDLLIELFSWLKIAASPFLAGLFIGGMVYFNSQTKAGLLSGIVIAFIGLITGIVWATRIWKREGANNFLSEIMRNPEFDKSEKKNAEK